MSQENQDTDCSFCNPSANDKVQIADTVGRGMGNRTHLKLNVPVRPVGFVQPPQSDMYSPISSDNGPNYTSAAPASTYPEVPRPQQTNIGGEIPFPDHGPRKEPTNEKIPSSPTPAHAALSLRILAQAVPVYTGHHPWKAPAMTRTEKVQGRRNPANNAIDAKWVPNSHRERTKSEFIGNIARNGTFAEELKDMNERLEELRRFTLTMSPVVPLFKALEARTDKFRESLRTTLKASVKESVMVSVKEILEESQEESQEDEEPPADKELFEENMSLVTKWALEKELAIWRHTHDKLLERIQAAIKHVVKKFFARRGPVLGEPTEYERKKHISVQESAWVLNDLKATFPEAVEEYGKHARAGPADGGGCAAPPNSRADMLLLDFAGGGGRSSQSSSPRPPPQWPPPTKTLVSYTMPSSSTLSAPSVPGGSTQKKRNRVESEEPLGLAVRVKRTKVDEMQSQPIAREGDEEPKVVDVTPEEPKAREGC